MSCDFVRENRLRLRFEPVAKDRTDIRDILTSTNTFYPYEIDVAIELIDDRLEKGDQSDYSFIFLESDGQTIGYTCYGPIYMTDNRFDLYWIAVREELRAKGFGGFLLRETEKKIREVNGTYIYVETSGKNDYRKTRSFYKKCGYRKVARIPHFYKDNDDKIIYMKGLGTT